MNAIRRVVPRLNRVISSNRSLSNGNSVSVFDRGLKMCQREWAANLPNADYYDYLRKEAADRIVDRIDDISRDFPMALEIGSHRGHLYNLIKSRENMRGDKGNMIIDQQHAQSNELMNVCFEFFQVV